MDPCLHGGYTGGIRDTRGVCVRASRHLSVSRSAFPAASSTARERIILFLSSLLLVCGVDNAFARSRPEIGMLLWALSFTLQTLPFRAHSLTHTRRCYTGREKGQTRKNRLMWNYDNDHLALWAGSSGHPLLLLLPRIWEKNKYTVYTEKEGEDLRSEIIKERGEEKEKGGGYISDLCSRTKIMYLMS